MYEKERSGRKNNTLRRMRKKEARYPILKEYENMLGELPLWIEIENKHTEEYFTRRVKDITFWDGYVIITWEHE